MPALPLAEVFKPIRNNNLPHTGIVVSNTDPTNTGRIKVCVAGILEATNPDLLPWAYPKQSSTAGGGAGGSEFGVPQLYDTVTIEFPYTNNWYYIEYTGMRRNQLTNAIPGTTNTAPDNPNTTYPYTPNPTVGSDLQGGSWLNQHTGKPGWLRIDTNKGTLDLYDGSTGALFHLDRNGLLSMTVSQINVNVTGNCFFQVGGDYHVKVAGNHYTEVAGNQVNNVTGSVGTKIGSNYQLSTGLAYEVDVGTSYRAFVGGDWFSDTTGQTVLGTAGVMTVQANVLNLLGTGNLHASSTNDVTLYAGNTVSRDAPNLIDNGGVGEPVSPGTFPSMLNTLANLESTLSNNPLFGQAFVALAAIGTAFSTMAIQTATIAQQTIAAVQSWYNTLTGTPRT